MKSEKEKQLEIQLLTEKIQRISGKKVVLKEGTWAIPASEEDFEKAEELLRELISLRKRFYSVLGDDILFDGFGAAESRAKELIEIAKGNVNKTSEKSNTYQEIKQQVKEMKSCISDLNDFYNRKITGDILYKRIVEKTPSLQIENKEAYLDFLEQINKPKRFGEWTLPKESSGSFYTAFLDSDFFYENEDLTEKEVEELIEYLKN